MSNFALLLTTYNGKSHLPEQLATLEMQTVPHIDIWCSDDGSTDGTPDLIAAAADKWTKGVFHIRLGPGAGFAENFRSLICMPDIDADFVAFCDQDDLWDADKLEIAAQKLRGISAAVPAVYCSRTRLMEEDGRIIGQSPLMANAPSFRNALVQSIAGANTMVMNRAAFDLVRQASMDTPFVSHDWWCYLLVTGAGGKVVYDPEPHISYRQHEGNLVGANLGLDATLRRYKLLLSGRFARWTDTNLQGLSANAHLLTSENAATVHAVIGARKAGRGELAKTILRHGLRRQSVFGNFVLFVGTMLGKI